MFLRVEQVKYKTDLYESDQVFLQHVHYNKNSEITTRSHRNNPFI